MPKVFISYSTKDAVFADLAKMKLNEEGVDVWLDSGDLHGGDQWREAIDHGISNSDALLVILTPDSCASSYVTYEWGFALGMGKKVIPIMREDATVHPRLEAFQHLDFRDHRTAPWANLALEIQKAEQSKSNANYPTRVGEMTSEDLKEIIVGALALATASAKSTGQRAEAKDISSAAESMVGAMKQSAGRGRDTKSRHILWVDDRPDNNIYERDAFKALGFEFTLALSTDEALEKLGNQSYSAIISDMGRVEGPREGYVLLEALRRDDQKTPFFIYAGSNAPEHKKQAARLGAQGSTNNPRELIELVSMHVG
jgi:CheY-like chemotaxis protein